MQIQQRLKFQTGIQHSILREAYTLLLLRERFMFYFSTTQVRYQKATEDQILIGYSAIGIKKDIVSNTYSSCFKK